MKNKLRIEKCLVCGNSLSDMQIEQETLPHYCPDCVSHLQKYGFFPVTQQNDLGAELE